MKYDLKHGQKVVHKVYGLCTVLQSFVSPYALLLNIETKQGKAKFRHDRRGFLPRCYENNMKLIELENTKELGSE